MKLAHLWWEHDFGHLEATMLGQLEARIRFCQQDPNCALTIGLVSPTPSQTAAVERFGTQAWRAMGLAHLWWEHDFGHLEATMFGQFGGRMNMMPGGPKLCSP